MPLRSKVIGYEVFYSMTAVEDLGQWQRKTVGLTTSIDLVNLERHAQVGKRRRDFRFSEYNNKCRKLEKLTFCYLTQYLSNSEILRMHRTGVHFSI